MEEPEAARHREDISAAKTSRHTVLHAFHGFLNKPVTINGLCQCLVLQLSLLHHRSPHSNSQTQMQNQSHTFVAGVVSVLWCPIESWKVYSFKQGVFGRFVKKALMSTLHGLNGVCAHGNHHIQYNPPKKTSGLWKAI